jgi:hypothetical protein
MVPFRDIAKTAPEAVSLIESPKNRPIQVFPPIFRAQISSAFQLSSQPSAGFLAFKPTTLFNQLFSIFANKSNVNAYTNAVAPSPGQLEAACDASM